MSDFPFEIRTDPLLGRHLVASRHISPGALVLKQEPYAAVLYDDQLPIRCDCCFRTSAAAAHGSDLGGPMLRCSRSKLARYCCREHQVEAWRRGYQRECKALVASAPRRIPTPSIRLVARTLWRRIGCGRNTHAHRHTCKTCIYICLLRWWVCFTMPIHSAVEIRFLPACA